MNAPVDTYVTAAVLTHPDTVTPSWSGRIRDLVGVLGIGVVGTLLAALAFDRHHRRKLSNLSEGSEAASTAGALVLIETPSSDRRAPTSPRPIPQQGLRPVVASDGASAVRVPQRREALGDGEAGDGR